MERRLRDRLTDALERTKRLLDEQARRARVAGRGGPGEGAGDEGDRALADHLKEMVFSVGDVDSRLLTQVEGALARLQRGEYGVCTFCGEPIAVKRLQAAPWVERCLPCQEQEESRGAA
jgi:DnaK suppressor protein